MPNYLCAAPKYSCSCEVHHPSHRWRHRGRHLLRAGIRAPNYGAHLLRHSLVTCLVNQGVPIKQIADLLGHVSINTTAIYTKVDTVTLAAVALAFAGGESC